MFIRRSHLDELLAPKSSRRNHMHRGAMASELLFSDIDGFSLHAAVRVLADDASGWSSCVVKPRPISGPILRAVNVQRPANSPAPSLQRPDCALNPPRLATFGLLRVRLRGFSGPFLGRPMAFENPIPATSFDLGQLPSVSVADRQAHGVLERDSPAPPNPRSPAGGTCATGSGHGKPHFHSGWG